jgi:hypothetical protein
MLTSDLKLVDKSDRMPLSWAVHSGPVGMKELLMQGGRAQASISIFIAITWTLC